jgi:hypothetical protein
MSNRKILALMKSKTICLSKIAELTQQMMQMSESQEVFTDREVDGFLELHEKRSQLFDLLDLYNNELLDLTAGQTLTSQSVGEIEAQLATQKKKSKEIFDCNEKLIGRIHELQKVLRHFYVKQLNQLKTVSKFKSFSDNPQNRGNGMDEWL